MKKLLILLSILVLLPPLVSAFIFNGTINDIDGVPMNGTLVNLTMYTMGDNGPQLIASNASISDTSGLFSINASDNTSWFFKPVITHTNSTLNFVDYTGKSLPTLPYGEISAISDIDFYLQEAATINITAVNSSGSIIPFGYIVKDVLLGYEVSLNTNTSTTGALVYLPKNRNYSIMIWPAQGSGQNFVPVSYNWNNFSSLNSYNIGSLSSYNATTRTLHKQFNTTESFAWVSGYINDSSIAGWDEFMIVPYVLEPSNMVFMGMGGLPKNASAWRGGGATDTYNLTSGFYNITLPYSATETVRYMLLAAARNGSSYRASFRNITVTGDLTNFNFSMYGLLGDVSNITIDDSVGGSPLNISTKQQAINLVNTTSIISSISAHTEITVDYSSYGSMEFTFMEDISSSTGTITVPLLNVTGIKEINVYSSDYAPKRVSTKTVAELSPHLNITMAEFSPGEIPEETVIADGSITIDIYKSNSTCDVPNPDSGCSLANSSTMDEFNPFSLVLGGGKITFRMGVGDVLVSYINVDMLASGPPDAMFEDDNTISEGTSGGFSKAMRFGSNGPTIYDYVLISIPYTEGSTSTSGLNESADVNISIPLLYDEDWNVMWNTSSNGTAGAALAANYTHYEANSAEWETLMGNNTCVTNVSQFNETNPCYIDTTNNRIWIRLPHFSGTGPSVSGSSIIATSNPPSGGGGSSTKKQCDDNLDNDGDGLTDYPDDPGCISTNDDSEDSDAPCAERWMCGSWKDCTEQGKQTKICFDIGRCGTENNKPITEQSCTYEAEEEKPEIQAAAVIDQSKLEPAEQEGVEVTSPTGVAWLTSKLKGNALKLTILGAMVVIIIGSIVIINIKKKH